MINRMYYDRDNDIERLFHEDARDKKITARGARYNSGRRGGGTKGVTRGLRMPSDVMKYNNKKAYKEYIKGSVVKVSNMYDNLEDMPSLKEIVRDNTPAEVKNILTQLKSRHTNKKLMNHFGISCGKLYSTYIKYGVEYESRPGVMKRKKNLPLIESVETPAVQEIAAAVNEEPVRSDDSSNAFEIKYLKKDVNGKSIQDQITSLVSILNNDSRYEIKVTIREIEG